MIALLLAAALQTGEVGPPAPVPAADQMVDLLKRQAASERQAKVLRGTLGDFAWLAGGGILDGYGTEWALHRRPGMFYETSGAGANASMRIWYKAGTVLLTTWVCKELREDGHEKTAKLLSRIGGGTWGALGVFNMWQAR